MADKRTLDVYEARAKDYARLTASSRPDPSLQSFIDALAQGAVVLDLGCGPATASAHMRAAGLKPDPVDAAPAMVALANEMHDIGARLASFDDITGAAVYDGVWANFSLLHADRADLPRHIRSIAQALKPDGLLHIGMKTGTGSHRDPIDRLYTYVTVAELVAMLAEVGLNVTETQEGEERGLAGTIDPFVLCRAVKE